MSEPQDSAELLQNLPPGLPRRHAEYKPVDEASSSLVPPTNLGGYDELLAYFKARGHNLPRSDEGLAAIDHLIDGATAKESLAVLARSIGMFYGDVLTHTVPGAHWEAAEEGYPRVRVTRKTAVDVVRVATRRLETADPTLVQNYAHVVELVRQGEP
jgi:Family of unknown function (DUF6278)